MSVVINMKMPENCRECRFGYDGKCFAEQPFHRFFVGDTHKCPLIELPPHGRLIDADALSYQLEKQETIDGQPRAIRRARRIVNDFPTTIPAEEGE